MHHSALLNICRATTEHIFGGNINIIFHQNLYKTDIHFSSTYRNLQVLLVVLKTKERPIPRFYELILGKD